MEPITMGILALIGAIASVTTSTIQNSYNTAATKSTNEANIEMTKEANAAQLQQVREINEFNSAEAQKARDYDMMMSNTQVQRSMADYQAAGLNPLLAATNGATYSAPVSASGNVATIKAGKAEAPQLDLSGISSAASSLSNLLLISNIMGSKASNNNGVRPIPELVKYRKMVAKSKMAPYKNPTAAQQARFNEFLKHMV